MNPSEAFREYQSIRYYEALLDDLDSRERDRRLAIVEEFCAFVDRTPDQMAAEIYDRETHKYRKRGFYTERVRAFSEQLDVARNLQLARGNIIRSFFIANGSRLLPERPDWM